MEDKELKKELTAINEKLDIIIELLSKENDDEPKPKSKKHGVRVSLIK